MEIDWRKKDIFEIIMTEITPTPIPYAFATVVLALIIICSVLRSLRHLHVDVARSYFLIITCSSPSRRDDLHFRKLIKATVNKKKTVLTRSRISAFFK